MKPREKRIVTALINTVKQKVYTVDQVILMAEDFYNRHMLTEDALDELYDRLDKRDEMDAPPVNVAPVRRGYWIDNGEQSYTWKVRCSVCGHERSMMSTQGEYPNYCENCGARMDVERKENFK